MPTANRNMKRVQLKRDIQIDLNKWLIHGLQGVAEEAVNGLLRVRFGENGKLYYLREEDVSVLGQDCP